MTTIASADNLLYFKSRSELVSAAKGTDEYNTIFEKLKSISYAAGDPENNSDEEEDEDELVNEYPGIDEDITGEEQGSDDGALLNTTKVVGIDFEGESRHSINPEGIMSPQTMFKPPSSLLDAD